MCQLLEKVDKKSIIAYKVVVKIGNKYYSPATGIRYKRDNKHIPIVTKMNPLVDAYIDFLDKDSDAYEPEMLSRTAAFLDIDDAIYERNSLDYFYSHNHSILCILQVKLSGDLMSGLYGNKSTVGNKSIVAGRQMQIIKEIS